MSEIHAMLEIYGDDLKLWYREIINRFFSQNVWRYSNFEFEFENELIKKGKTVTF